MNYTKGEWKRLKENPTVIIAQFQTGGVKQIAKIYESVVYSTNEANACLISAAPEMYEVLKQYEQMGIFKEYPNYLEGLRNILAKAEGKENK